MSSRVDAIPTLAIRKSTTGSVIPATLPVSGELGRRGGPPPGAGGHNMDHVCLRIESWDEAALLAHLRANGIEPGEVGRRYGAEGQGPSIYIADPDGNTVELKGPPDGRD